MPHPQPQSGPVPLEYLVLTLAYGSEPPWQTLGADGWLLTAVYDDAVRPNPAGKPFDGRTFVFTRPGGS